MTQENDSCSVCGHLRSEHPYRHAFVGPSDQQVLHEVTPDTPPPPREPGDPPASVRVSPPGDSVLRLALLRLGVITLADLEVIEAELRGAGLAFHDPETMGKPRDR